MKILLILRHAKSSWSNSRLADHDRPLNKRGKRDAPRMGRLLREEALVPDLIISSTAIRALKTAEMVAQACEYDGVIASTRDLYHGEPEDYIGILRDTGADFGTVMVVGHNPGISALVEDLTGDYDRMPTAALAKVAVPLKHWSELSIDTEATLDAVWWPKELD